MATLTPKAKRIRLTKSAQVDDRRINEVAVKAADVVLPWDKVSPPYFSEWIDIFSKAHGAASELMFMAVLPTVSCLLGLSKLHMTSTYKENLGLFMLGICPPSGGKNQCFSFGCKQPVTAVEDKNGKCLLLDKFTEVGLRQHLMQNSGVALIVNEEMEDTLRHIQTERECGTLCRLFDGDSLYINSGSCGARQTIEQTSVSIGGFMQVRQFFSEIYPAMVSTQSGFDLRFLFAVVRPTAHTRKETQPFANKLSNTNVPHLHDVYKAIYEDHQHGDVIYTLNDRALALYDAFDEQFCQKLNDKWQNGHMLDSSATEGGKERRLVLRVAVALFVLYSYVRRQLFQSYGRVPRVVPEAYMKYAINLMAYFQQQRKEIDQILLHVDEQEEAHDHICDKLVRYPGPVCTINNFRAIASSKTRKEWTPAVVRDAMDKLANSEDQTGIGEVITLDRTVAFVKRSPEAVTKEMLSKHSSVCKEEYEQWFHAKDFNLSLLKQDNLIRKAQFSNEIIAALARNKEN